MNSYKNKYIYWTLLTHKNWCFHIAATENGLCFIGSQDENFEELTIWARKKLPQYKLTRNPDYLQTYTKEIIEYLENNRETFTFPIDAYGTSFQLSVWNTVREIPYGKTYSYSEIAEKCKNLQLYVPLLLLLLPTLFSLQFLAIVLLERMEN